MEPDVLNRKSGQSMIEFMVAMVAVLLLFVGLLQIAQLARIDFESKIIVRSGVAEKMLAPAALPDSGFIYAGDNYKSSDGKMYTPDDIVQSGDLDVYSSAGAFFDSVHYVQSSATPLAEYLDTYQRSDPYSALLTFSRNNCAGTYDMVYDFEENSVPVLPFIKKMLRGDSVGVYNGVWMPRLGEVMK